MRQGAVWSLSLIVSRQLVSLGATAVLSRLLVPDDFGLICMVATLTTLLQTFTDMGLSWATIGSEKLTLGQVDALFWVNAAVGVLLWAHAS